MTRTPGSVSLERQVRDAVVDAAMALARPVDMERALQEAVQQLHSALACDAVAIALAGEESSILHLAHQSWGAEAPAALEEGLMPTWLEALAGPRAIARTSAQGMEITAPMPSSDGVIGAVTVSLAAPLTSQRVNEAQQILIAIAAHVGTAIGRAWAIQRMIHKRRLEAASEVSVGVAHELRNPLFGISSAAQLLRFRVKDDPVVEKNVGRILREVDRLNNFATELLEYGRPTPVRLQAGDPDAVWDEVLERQRGLLESRALLLQRSRAEPAARCAIDPQQLSQALANLLLNAADAAPEGTDLALHSIVLPNGAWRCRLRNGGPVIPPDVLPRMFELFFSPKPGSSGVGLALSRRIIEEHGGTLTLESKPELGTAATIVIPAGT